MKNLNSLLLLAGLLMSAQVGQGQTEYAANDQGIALDGYDVVAYHNMHRATRGNHNHTVKRNGQTFYFSNSDNREAFQKDPESYLPQFGGHCAFAMAMKGAKAPTDPETFKLRDGKLYLFYNDFYEGQPFNTIVPWNANEVEMLAKAQANWKKLK